jgi:hypothetical protein
LNISAPADGDSTTLNSILVAGTVSKGAVLAVNGASVKNNDGSFSYQLTLKMGDNVIKVIAADSSGKETTRSITVTETDPNALPPGDSGTPTPSNNPGNIVLSGTGSSGVVNLTWIVTGVSITNGFRLVYNTGNAAPVYPPNPGDNYFAFTDSTLRTYSMAIQAGQAYNFRICQYSGDASCLIYSNAIVVTPTPTPTPTPSPTPSPTAMPSPTGTMSPTANPD